MGEGRDHIYEIAYELEHGQTIHGKYGRCTIPRYLRLTQNCWDRKPSQVTTSDCNYNKFSTQQLLSPSIAMTVLSHHHPMPHGRNKKKKNYRYKRKLFYSFNYCFTNILFYVKNKLIYYLYR